MRKENTSILGYLGHGVLFIFEVSIIPYYQLECAYYRAQIRMNNFYK
jgi:hypothetical protein